MVSRCSASGCSKTSDLYKIRYHRFPLHNLPLLKKWTKAIRRKDFVPTKFSKVCGDHFVEDDYCGARLKPTAVPSIFNFEAANQSSKSTKILAPKEEGEEEDNVSTEELQLVQPELRLLSELPEQQPSPLEPMYKNNQWNPLAELGLGSEQVELRFEDEQPKCLRLIAFNASYEEKGSQTLHAKCTLCRRYTQKFRLLQQQIARKENRIRKMKNLIAGLKQEILESKKPKIKIIGNSVILVDKFDNTCFNNVLINEDNQVTLGVS